MSQPSRTPLAIVGVSALFPGSVDKTGFWRNIVEGADLLTDVPPGHWLIEDYYDADPSAPDKTYAKRGGFLPDVDFDALSWGIPPSIVPATDTAQLLALIVAQQVLSDATRGDLSRFDRERTSVILGVTSAQELLGSMVSRLQRPVWTRALREAGLPESEVGSICDRIAANYAPWQESTFPGLLGNVVAGRIANRLGIGGTNCVTDAACASTFSALSMAASELYLGDSDLVVCGGVDTMNDIFMYMCFSKTPAMSPTGDCRPFSDAADGTMLGEGLGMFALRRLEDAERDGDPIYAVIRGVGTSSDGRSKSVYAPLPKGQAKSIRRALAHAGYGAETVELIEAHGTGTKAGDAAEFEGLRMVFDESGRADRQWCALGSVKSQVGHTKAAAGAAGLFKAVLALQHKTLPPSAKIARPNPKLNVEESPFYLSTEARPWVRSADHPRRAGVSSFGFGGSNFHVSVEEYTGPGRAKRARTWDAELVLVAGSDGAEVAAKARALADEAESAPKQAESLLQFLAARSRREAKGPARLALVVANAATLATRLRSAAQAIEAAPEAAFERPDGTAYGVGEPAGGVAFVFPGQGSQSIGMCGAAARNFDAAISAWDEAAALDLADAGLHEVVFPRPVFDDADREAQAARLTATEWAQPAIGCASESLLRLMQAVGITPDAVAGHSFGEVTALRAAGALSPADFLRVARLRGEQMAAASGGRAGAMTAVSATRTEVEALIEASGAAVVLANHNHPKQVVVSG
ncbi:MAG: beta-ketoacyl synthase N-terminal-like domain-containing protein, partial [Planctomycetota bacterium]